MLVKYSSITGSVFIPAVYHPFGGGEVLVWKLLDLNNKVDPLDTLKYYILRRVWDEASWKFCLVGCHIDGRCLQEVFGLSLGASW